MSNASPKESTRRKPSHAREVSGSAATGRSRALPIVVACVAVVVVVAIVGVSFGLNPFAAKAGKTLYGVVDRLDGDRVELTLGDIGEVTAEELVARDGVGSGEEGNEDMPGLGDGPGRADGADDGASEIQDLESMSEDDVREMENISAGEDGAMAHAPDATDETVQYNLMNGAGDGASTAGGNGSSAAAESNGVTEGEPAYPGQDPVVSGDATPPGVSLEDRGLAPAKPGARSAGGDENGGAANDDASVSDDSAPEPQARLMSFKVGDETIEIDIAGVKTVAGTYEDGAIKESAAGTSADPAADSATESSASIYKGSVLALEYDFFGKLSRVVQLTNVLSQSALDGTPDGDISQGDVQQGTAAFTIDSDAQLVDMDFPSTGVDENALRIDGATAQLSAILVDKSFGPCTDVEAGDFYGMNAALLATNGADVTVSDSEILSSAQNGNGIFSYGEGTVVSVSDTLIATIADNSGGIQTTGGATTKAYNLTVTTQGSSSAPIRTDRGGGHVEVEGGNFMSAGPNSPAIYSTADVSVSGAQLAAEGSEALVIEGQNSIRLADCTVSGSMSDTDGSSSDENVHNVMIYQSMSGDAAEGTAELAMTGGSLVCNNGDMFYVTNTDALMTLEGVALEFAVESDGGDGSADGAGDGDTAADVPILLRVCGNSGSHGWGKAGHNGGTLRFVAKNQELMGAIVVDRISSLDMELQDGCTFEGSINIVDNEDGGNDADGAEHAKIVIGSGCTWKLTGDCTLDSLQNDGTIDYNGFKITFADGTVWQ